MRNLVKSEGVGDEEKSNNKGSINQQRSDSDTLEPSGWLGTPKASKGEAWALHWKGPRHIIFGHDAMRKLQKFPFATGIDTGCVYGNALTACVLPPISSIESTQLLYESSSIRGNLISVPASKVYCPVD